MKGMGDDGPPGRGRRRGLLLGAMAVLLAVGVALPALVADGPATRGPRIVNLAVSPTVVPTDGGQTTVVAGVDNARLCRLQLLSRPSFRVAYSHGAQSCFGYDFASVVTIGPNEGSATRGVVFELVAQTGHLSTAHRFNIALGPRGAVRPAKPLTRDTFPGPSFTTTTGSIGPESEPPATSANWSGYAVVGGPYTAVQGTFTVPYLAKSTNCGSHVTEWVGIDGFASDRNLIQAGVDTSMVDPTTGYCIPHVYWAEPWWALWTGAQTPIPNVRVSPGDRVTVSVSQVGPTRWDIRLKDDNNRQRFETQQTYFGAAQTAEWIVEAPSFPACGRTCSLAPFTAPVRFLSARASGVSQGMWTIDLLQGGHQLDRPSNFSHEGFAVTYTGPDRS